MGATIQAIRDTVDAIRQVETSLSGTLYQSSFAAEYGHGSTSKAIDFLEESRRHADRAVVAAAVGNALMAAKHEVQAADAEADAGRMLERARGYADEVRDGVRTAGDDADTALRQATSLVAVDDSSPAAEIHLKIAAQPEAVKGMEQRAEEVHRTVAGSRDPAALRAAADNFLALRQDLEDGSGTAQQIASDCLGYGNAI